MLLSREDIFKSQDRTYQEVHVPEWGGAVRMQSLTAKELEEYQKSNRGKVDRQGNAAILWEGSAARLVVRCAVDKEGQRIFGADDALELGRKSAAAVNRLFKVACTMNGITQEEQDEIIKNSEPTQSAASSTD